MNILPRSEPPIGSRMRERRPCRCEHLAHRRQIAWMHAAIDPANGSVRIDRSRPGVTRGIFHARRIPVHTKSRRFIFHATCDERGIAVEFREIEIVETHRVVGRHRLVAEAERIGVVPRAEGFGFRLRTDRDEANCDCSGCEFASRLAQLRERIGKESSTDVAEPHDEHRSRNIEL